SIEHELYAGDFYTTFGFGLKDHLSVQPKGVDLSNVIPPITGLHIGEVKKIDKDPDNEYRIKVFIPALKTSGDGLWARLTHFYTSPGAGSFFIPEVKTQVVVSFINNDPRHPVILGGLYTKTTKPYTEIKSKNEKKAFVSKEKLTLEFDDKDKVIVIKTSNKNKITISEKLKGIKVEDQNGNEIKTSRSGISISSKDQIKITSKKAVSITGSKGVTISGKSGKGVSLDGSKMDVKSKGKVNVKGSGVDLKGSGAINIKGGSVNIN
ncbi:MAG: phage baseplate assembly protein V, partial [Flavobacteriaceae bacterium]